MKGKIDEYSDSDDDQHDAYLERMKAEGKIREEGNDSDESDSGSGESIWYQTCDQFCKSVGVNGLPVVFTFQMNPLIPEKRMMTLQKSERPLYDD